MKKRLFLLYLLAVSILGACSGTDAPEPSQLPLPTPTLAPSEELEPDEPEPIHLSLSYMSSDAMEETRIYKSAKEFMRRHPEVDISLDYTRTISSGVSSEYIIKQPPAKAGGIENG